MPIALILSTTIVLLKWKSFSIVNKFRVYCSFIKESLSVWLSVDKTFEKVYVLKICFNSKYHEFSDFKELSFKRVYIWIFYTEIFAKI